MGGYGQYFCNKAKTSEKVLTLAVPPCSLNQQFDLTSCRSVVRALVCPGSIPRMPHSESAIARGNPILLLSSTKFCEQHALRLLVVLFVLKEKPPYTGFYQNNSFYQIQN